MKIDRGIVRPIVTLIFAVGITGGFFLGKIDAETFVPIAAMAISWWFTIRDTEKQNPGHGTQGK